MANTEVEARAIELVMQYEMTRLGLDTSEKIRRMPRGDGYDLESADGRKIEVKGTEGTTVNTGFRLNSSQEISFVEGGGYVYRVVDVFGTPTLHIFNGSQLTLYKSQWASVSAPAELLSSPIQLT